MFEPQPIQIDTASISSRVRQLLSYYRQKWGWILMTPVLFASIAIAWRYLSKPKYKASCSFVLEEKSNGAGGIAGLASQFGIDLGAMGGGSGNFFSGENIADIISSSTIMDQVLLSETDNNKTLADLYLDASGMRNGWGWQGKLISFSFSYHPKDAETQKLQDTALLVIREKLRKNDLVVDKTTKKGSIYGVSVESSDDVFAKLFTERLVQATGEMYINIKTRNITDNITKLEKRADSLEQLFGARSVKTFSEQILNANEAFKSNLANVEIGQRNKSVIFELYSEVMKNLEISRMMLMNQTPVIQILDKPQQPMVDQRSSVFKVFLLGGIAGLIFILLFLLSGFNRNH